MIIIISNFLKKFILLAMCIAVIITLFFLSITLWDSIKPQIFVTIENKISFNHPYSIKLNALYSNLSENFSCIESCKVLGKEILKHYKNFSSDPSNIHFKYPKEIQFGNPTKMDSDIEYHIGFSNPSIGAHGFIQIWKLQKPLKEFLEESKIYALTSYLSFTEEKIEVRNMQGYFWNTEILDKNIKIHGLEVFLEQDGEMIRISYFIPEKKYNRKQRKIFWDIVTSLEVK